MNFLDNVSSTVLNKSLDGLWARNKAIADNIANYETPGYKKKVVSFEQQLKEVLSQQNDSKTQVLNNIQNSDVKTTVIENETLRADGNNVDIEQENIELARTQLQYSLVTRQLSDHFSRMRYAISGGTSR